MSRAKFKPSISPVGKIKLIFSDQTDESESSNKFVKSCPEEAKVSDLPSLCLKKCDVSEVEIYINDELIQNEDLVKQLKEFGNKPIVIFKSKRDNYFTLYSLENVKGKEINYMSKKTPNFLLLLDIDEDTDTYFIFDENGKETTITNANFKDKVKNGDKFYLINYPKKLDKLPPPKLFDKIADSLNTTITDFKKLLCFLYKFFQDTEISKVINFQLSSDKKYKSLFPLAQNFIKKPNERFAFMKFIFTLPFIKKNKETYSKLFERLYETGSVESMKPFSIFDSKEFVYKSKIDENTIIQASEDTFGIYKELDKPGFYKYFDPYENKEILKSIDYSNIEDPAQITAIFVDTSGSMLASFNHTGQKLFKVAVEIANHIISNIHKFNIYDPIIVSTSFADILESERIPLNIDKSELNGKTNIWDKINSFLEEIKKRKGKKKYPSHIIIITDGEDTNSQKTREDILSKIKKEKIIVDSIILCDDNYTQDPLFISTYTNGVYLFVNDIDEAKEFVSKEPFYDMSIRKPINTKSLPKFPFGNPDKKNKKTKHYKCFEQLEPIYCNANNHYFYYDFEYGLLKPSPDKFKDNKSILAKEFLECLEKEKENPQYYTFLIRNRDFDEEEEDKKDSSDDDSDKDDDDDDDNDDDSNDVDEDYFPKKKVKNKYVELLNHWCVFIKFDNEKEKKTYFWQMEISFDSKYPVSLPTMRIISHPELITQKQELISEFGKVIFNKLINTPEKHYTVSELLDKLIKKIKVNFEYKKFKYHYENSPAFVINTSLTKKISIKFEDGWGNDIEDDEFEEEENVSEKVIEENTTKKEDDNEMKKEKKRKKSKERKEKEENVSEKLIEEDSTKTKDDNEMKKGKKGKKENVNENEENISEKEIEENTTKKEDDNEMKKDKKRKKSKERKEKEENVSEKLIEEDTTKTEGDNEMKKGKKGKKEKVKEEKVKEEKVKEEKVKEEKVKEEKAENISDETIEKVTTKSEDENETKKEKKRNEKERKKKEKEDKKKKKERKESDSIKTSEIPSSEMPSSEIPSSEIPSSETISSDNPSRPSSGDRNRASSKRPNKKKL